MSASGARDNPVERIAAIRGAARGASLLVLTLAACGPEPAHRPLPVDAGPPAPLAPTPFDGEVIEGSVVELEGRAEVPLGGHELDIREGDFMLRHGETVAVVSARKGELVAFGRAGGENGIVALDPTVFEALDSAPREVIAAEIRDGRLLHVTERVQTLPLELHVWWRAEARSITIASELVNTGAEEAAAVTLGELISFSNTPVWIEGHGLVAVGGSYGGAFLGRAGLGGAYALCDHAGRLNARTGKPSLPGYYRSVRTGQVRLSVAAGERSPVHRVTLAHAAQSVGDAVAALPCAGDREVVALPDKARGHEVEVAHCESEAEQAARISRLERDPKPEEALRLEGKPFVRYERGRREVAVPKGCARLRLTARGHAPGAWIDPRRDDAQGFGHDKLLPEAGALAWAVREEGDDGALPAQIIVRGREETKAPDWGQEGGDGAAVNFVYADKDGALPIPPGRYEVQVYRGFEYTHHAQAIEVKAGAEVRVEATLERVVDTSGFIAADLHVHARPSWDAPSLLEDRVRSLAAVGVEVAVATDHNAVTDYAPAIAALGLGDEIASIVGDEITTDAPLLGHFNVFPLPAGTPPLSFEKVRARELFTTARKLARGGIIQVNHPRMGDIGYFELLHLDRGDVRKWRAAAPLADLGFDAIEVFNGDHFAEIDEVRWVMNDWYALLEAGLRHTATGNSDSHKIAFQDAGMPRNWVALADDAPARFDAARFVAAVRAARVVVSSGPFIRFAVKGADRGIGDTIAPGEVELTLRVEAPPWIDVSEVELVRRGLVIERWKVAESTAAVRFERAHRLKVDAGDWLVAVAIGNKSMHNVMRSGAKPFAFTNPIWVAP
jgi:hypothetical protein